MATTLQIKKPKTARSTLNIRILPQERNLIDQAARARCKNRTDFILDAARQAAEETLLDRAMISVSPQAYQDFLERLDATSSTQDSVHLRLPENEKRTGEARSACSRAIP